MAPWVYILQYNLYLMPSEKYSAIASIYIQETFFIIGSILARLHTSSLFNSINTLFSWKLR